MYCASKHSSPPCAYERYYTMLGSTLSSDIYIILLYIYIQGHEPNAIIQEQGFSSYHTAKVQYHVSTISHTPRPAVLINYSLIHLFAPIRYVSLMDLAELS